MSKKRISNIEHKRTNLRNKKHSLTKSWFIQKLLGGMPLKSRTKNRAVLQRVFTKIRYTHKIDPRLGIMCAINKLKPTLWLRIFKRGRREYRIPYPLPTVKQYRYAIRWIIRSFKSRTERGLENRLFNEIMSLIKGKSRVFLWKKNLDFQIKRNRHRVNYKKKIKNTWNLKRGTSRFKE